MKTYKLAHNIIDQKDIRRLCEWLNTNPQLTKGKLTLEFEKLWAQWIGTEYAVFVNSGSSANLLMAYAVLLSGNLRNKKVIVPSVGWVTTIAPFIQFGFEPIMCGAEEDSFGLNPEELERLLKRHKPGAVALVQVLGVPSKMNEIMKLKKQHDFLLLEDSCAAYGAEYGGRKIGSFGDLSTFSFYFGHQLSTIEGGMVTTNNKKFYDLLLMLRSHGWGKDLDQRTRAALMKQHRINSFHKPFTFFVPGFNLRSTDLNAFLGIGQMRKADRTMAIRMRNHLLYAKSLKTVTFQKWSKESKPCSISFGALARSRDHRRRIVKALDQRKIETRLFSAGNLGLHPFWTERFGVFHDKVSDRIHDCGFFLPNNESLSGRDTRFIAEVVNNA